MKSYEVLRDAADKVGVKVLASELRLSPALVYKWCQEPESQDTGDGSGALNPLDRLCEIYRITGHLPVIDWLCAQADGFFVHNPRVKGRDLDAELITSTQQLVEGFSRLLAEVSRSVADDNRISAAEAERMRGSWEKLKTTAETFVHAAERGVYSEDNGRANS